MSMIVPMGNMTEKAGVFLQLCDKKAEKQCNSHKEGYCEPCVMN